MMRVSGIAAWVECETRALHSPRMEGRHGIAAWVGTMAHAMLAGQPRPPTPSRLSFDAMTTTEHQAAIQASDIAECASEIMDAHRIGVLEAEMAVRTGDVTGHLDLLVWDREQGKQGVLDLKTGQFAGAAWLQVGGYLTGCTTAEFGGVLHVPRQKIGKVQGGTLERRDAEPLRNAWEARLNRIQAVQHGAPALPSPGLHCSRCPVRDCVVRI